MMKQIKTSLFASAILLALAACGSSGGNGGNQININGGSGNGGNSGNNNSSSAAVQKGTAYSAAANDSANAVSATLSGDKDGVIVVNGKQIMLKSPNVSFEGPGFTSLRDSTGELQVSGNKYSYVRFGSLSDMSSQANIQHYTFAVGNVTPERGSDAVPTTGQANYKGDAVSSFNGNPFEQGESSFAVDFAARSIKGFVKHENQTNIPLEGQISGNSFSGSKDGVNMQGHFYGAKAAELGGTFAGKQTTGEKLPVMGSFSAKKE